jgi:hypothetical protein
VDVALKDEAPTLDTSKTRLVFLDIDGVLNSDKTFILAGAWPNLEVDHEADMGYFGGPRAKVVKAPYVKYPEGIDKYAVGLLNKLLVATNAHIVVSSTWREGVDIYSLRLVLGAMGVDPTRVIGKTPEFRGNRGEQIFDFLQGIKEKRYYTGPDFFVQNGRLIQSLSKVPVTVESYVILDDINDFLPQQMKDVVLTDGREGLSLDDTLLCGAALTGKDFELNHLIHGEEYQGRILWTEKEKYE